MVFMQGFKCREAAAELHVPLGTVLSRLSRAREVLRESLETQARPAHTVAGNPAGDSGVKVADAAGEGER